MADIEKPCCNPHCGGQWGANCYHCHRRDHVCFEPNPVCGLQTDGYGLPGHVRPPRRRTTQAYLLLVLDVSTTPPTIKGAGIFSEQNPTCMGSTRYALVADEEGESFQEAYTSLRERLADPRDLKRWHGWILPLLSERDR